MHNAVVQVRQWRKNFCAIVHHFLPLLYTDTLENVRENPSSRKQCTHVIIECAYFFMSRSFQVIRYGGRRRRAPCSELEKIFSSIIRKGLSNDASSLFSGRSTLCRLQWSLIEQCSLMYVCVHSSEIRGLCLMKCPNEMLQNFPYFIYTKYQICFIRFSFHATLLFHPMNALVYVDID